MPGKTGDHFKPGDLVFAKMKGFPPWPARVCKSESNYKKRVPVFFFGTHQIGHLPPQNIVPFVGNKVKYGNSGVRIKGFTEGMWEIQNTPGVGSKPRNNTQSTSAKPASSPNISAAKAAITQTETSEQVTDQEAKTPLGAPTADKSDSKVVRRRRSNVKGGAAVVALATKRATRRSSPAETTPASTPTSVIITATDVPVVVKKRRGRKPKSVLAETTTGTTTTDSATAFKVASHKQGEEADNRESAPPTNTTLTEKEKSPDVPSEAKDLSAVSQQTASTSCGDLGESTKLLATRRKLCKVVAEQEMKLADAVEDTPVSKRLKGIKTNQPSKSLQNEEEQTEENVQSSGSRGLTMKEEKEVVKETCQEPVGKKTLMMEKPKAKRGRRKKKEENESEEAEKDKKTKEDEELQFMKQVERGITESEEKKETKRRGVRGVRGRRGRGPGTRTREWRGSTEKQQVNEVTEMTVGKKRGRKRKAKEAPGEVVETEVRDEGEEEERRKPSQVDDKDMKKRKVSSEYEKEEDVQTDDDTLESETGKKKESPLVDKRQHHLADKRDRVLKSLRGLLKAGRGGGRRRKDASNTYLKPLDRAKKKGGRKASDKRWGKQTLSEEKKVPKKLEDETKDKEKYEKKAKRGERTEVKEDDPKVEPQKAKILGEVKEKGKDLRVKGDETMKPGEKKDTETKEKREEERNANDASKNKQEEKNERKIIGKIVKASAGQKAKVQMKTVIGGVIKAAEEEKEKKKTEESNRERSNELETKGLANSEEKNAERSAGVERKSYKGKITNVSRKEKPATVEKDKRMRRSNEGEQKRLKKDSATPLGKNSEIKVGNEAIAVKKVKVDERKVKPERESQPAEEPKTEEKESAGNDDKTVVLDCTGVKTSTSISGTQPEQPDGFGKEEEEADERKSDSSDGERVKRQRKSSSMTLTDSTLHRIHGDIRISLKTDNPDINKCLMALDQLSMVYVTSKHIQRHTELVVTLRKLRCYRASQTIMDKASMLYNRFKNAYLLGEGEEVVSAGFLHTLLEEKEREEAQRAQRYKEKAAGAELVQEVKTDMGQGQVGRRDDGEAEATGGAESRVQKDA